MQGLKIIILNGSPKGLMSVTMQYMHYLEKRFPNHSYEIINAAQTCTKFEKNEAYFNETMSKIVASDLIIWAYPVYFALVCSQYKRFIELLFERGAEGIFRGKYTAALSTSIHFFDNTAMNYIKAVSDDLQINFISGITPAMDDLLNDDFRSTFDSIFLSWEKAVRNKQLFSRSFAPIEHRSFNYQPAQSLNVSIQSSARVCIVGDLEDEHSNIRMMVKTAERLFPEADIIDLGKMNFSPCIGCLKCGFDNICAYEGKDEYIDLYRGTILQADIIIYAGAMHDRYLSSTWQRYLERTFNRTHQPTLEGKQVGFIISGPLSQNHNAREILQAYTEVMGGCNAGFVTDECADSSRISAEIENLVQRTALRAEANVSLPKSFLGVGGRKVFRDDIYSHLRFVFQADHKYYKHHGLYDFPQKNLKMRFLTGAATFLTKIPPMRKVIRQQLRQGMLRPYKKLFERVVPLEDESDSRKPLVFNR